MFPKNKKDLINLFWRKIVEFFSIKEKDHSKEALPYPEDEVRID